MRPLDHPRGRDPGPAPSQVLLPELPARARVHEVRDAGEQPLADGDVGGLGKHDLALGEASREVLREVRGVPLDELPVQGLGGDDLPEEVRRRPGGDLAAASAGDAGDRTRRRSGGGSCPDKVAAGHVGPHAHLDAGSGEGRAGRDEGSRESCRGEKGKEDAGAHGFTMTGAVWRDEGTNEKTTQNK